MNNIRDAEGMRKCSHEPCQCLVPSTQEYCSAYCSVADDVDNTEFQCDCGHGKCVHKRARRLFVACIEGQGNAENRMAAGRTDVLPQDNSRNFAN
jgi:hypothetical protein